ncbi:MAG: glycosyltransferase family 39 protein [Candidatus Sumerlaeaceae bacterium]
MSKLRHYVVAAFLFLIALGMRVYNFRNAELPGFPEIIATLDALLPFADYLRTEQIDLCPPVYYGILKPVTFVGTSLWLIRLPSLLMGALTVPLLYLLIRRFASEGASLMSAFLLALSPLHIFYSQQAEPLVFAACVVLLTFVVFQHMREEHSVRLWLLYDGLLIVLLHLHREAAFVATSFLALHLVRLWWLRATASRLRWRRLPPLAVVLFHHFVVAVISLPWLAIMPTKASWYDPRPQWSELLKVVTNAFFLGLSFRTNALWLTFFGLVYLLLAPALVHVVRRRAGAAKSTLLASLLIVLLPFLWSQSGRTRFMPFATPVLALPLVYLSFGILLAHSHILVRLPATVLAALMMLKGLGAQNREPNNPPYAKVAKAIEQNAAEGAVVVTWPDFAERMSRYFLGDRYQIVTASDFFEKWAAVPRNQVIYFTSYQFPWREAHPYTLWGALDQFSQAQALFRERLNLAAAAQKFDMVSLRLWYDDPDTLRVMDQPTTATLFLFGPHDRPFRGPEFATDFPSLQYELSGRRCVWLTREKALISLPVSLEPGHYVLRLHASPDFICPDSGEWLDRRVNVVMRVGAEQIQATLEDETNLELPIEIEEEAKSLTLELRVDRTDTVECPRRTKIALKIYSLAIETVGEAAPMEK